MHQNSEVDVFSSHDKMIIMKLQHLKNKKLIHKHLVDIPNNNG